MQRREEWREVPEMDGVLASSLGRILLPPRYVALPNGGYRAYMPAPRDGCVTRSKTEAKHEYRNIGIGGRVYKVHQLICAAFHGPRPFDNAVVLHIDENALNNSADNLKWGTQKENLNAPGFRAYCASRVGDKSQRAKWAASRSQGQAL